MRLKSLLEYLQKEKELVKAYKPGGINIKNVAHDSRKVKKGDLFVAIKGLTVDSNKFIPEVIREGAAVVVGEKAPKSEWLSRACYIQVKSSRRALGLIASFFYGSPGEKLKVIGVTGTKGKTTVTFLIYWLLKNSKKVGLISTISAKIGDKEYDTGLHVTNPEPLPLQEFLSEMVKKGCEYAVVEVTSHGLDQERVAGINFDIAVLTNVAPEHLDYHKTYGAYKKAKAKLFRQVRVAILNRDDESYDYFKNFARGAEIISYGLKNEASYRGSDVSSDEFMTFNVRAEGKVAKFQSPLLGSYNALNALSAIAVARKVGIGWLQIQDAIKNMPNITGRLEKIKNKKGFDIYIDFAHTPESLENVLSFLKEKTKGRLIAVFGAAGERDSRKRPKMGAVAGKIADISLFTAEDPRSENAEVVIDQLAKGAKNVGTKERDITHINELIHSNENIFIRIPERGEAIALAVQKLAKKGDTVVICGKGHEKSMNYNGIEYPWSDQRAVNLALRGSVLVIER